MIDPRGIEFPKWAGQTQLIIAGFGTAPITRGEKDWRDWALAVIGFSQFGTLSIPDPRAFKSWRDWAFAFNQQVNQLGL